MKPPPNDIDAVLERIAGELPNGVRSQLAERERLHRTRMAAVESERRDRRLYLFALVVGACVIAALVAFAWVLIARHVI